MPLSCYQKKPTNQKKPNTANQKTQHVMWERVESGKHVKVSSFLGFGFVSPKSRVKSLALLVVLTDLLGWVWEEWKVVTNINIIIKS